MSVGLQLIRAVVENRSLHSFRELNETFFVEDELPAFRFVDQFMTNYGGLPSLAALQENGIYLPEATGPVDYHREALRDRVFYNAYATRQQAIMGAFQTSQMAEARRLIEEVATEMQNASAQQDTFALLNVAQEVWRDFQAAQRHIGLRGITYGWDALDEITSGIRPGDVATIVARPGIGKSWTIAKAAVAAWSQGRPVLFCSMEMTALESARRIIGMMSGTNPDLIQRGTLSRWGIDGIVSTVEQFGDMAPFTMLVGDLSKSVRDVDAMIQEYDPECVYIDASYLLKPTSGNKFRGKRWESAAEVAEEIKGLALRRNRPILQTVQFNRTQKDDEEMSLDNIGLTDAIGQVSSLVLGVKKGPTPNESTQRRYRVIKNRHGPDNLTFKTNFLFSPFNMDEIADDEDTGASPAGGDWNGQMGDPPARTEWGAE